MSTYLSDRKKHHHAGIRRRISEHVVHSSRSQHPEHCNRDSAVSIYQPSHAFKVQQEHLSLALQIRSTSYDIRTAFSISEASTRNTTSNLPLRSTSTANDHSYQTFRTTMSISAKIAFTSLCTGHLAQASFWLSLSNEIDTAIPADSPSLTFATT